MRRFACFLAPVLLTPPAAAAPWDAMIGNWRTTEIASCGIDDVRVGRILSISETTIRHGFVLCVIENGEVDGDRIEVDAQCDLGGGYETPLSYAWTIAGDEAVMRLNGYDTSLVRCGEIE